MKNILCCVLLLTFANFAFGDDVNDKSQDFSLGWNVSSFSNNYGLGAEAASPRFLDGTLHIGLSGDYAWVQGITAGNTQTSWFPYALIRLGVFGDHAFPNLPMRMYGGGGPLLLLPSSSTSGTAALGGGFGLVGLEFFLNPSKSHAMFLEFGGMGTGAVADKLAGSPIYANGFTISWGFRYFL